MHIGVDLRRSVASSMAISYPVGAIISMVVSGRLFDKLSDLGRLRMFVGQHALAVACLQVLCMAPSSGVLMMVCMAGTMMGVAPTIFLAPSALVTRYVRNHSLALSLSFARARACV